jgi:tetratricopeptide (TPR) repeat protein
MGRSRAVRGPAGRVTPAAEKRKAEKMTRGTLAITSTGAMRRTLALVIGMVGFVVVGCSSPEEKASSFVKDGKELLEKGNYVQAGLQFRNALQINSKLPEAWLSLAKIDLHDQKWDDALRDLNRVIQLDPNNKEALADLGGLQLGANQLDDAMKTSETLLKVAPDDASAHSLRGAVMYRLQNLDKALDEAEAALKIDPGHVDAILLAARIYQAKGDPDKALSMIEDGLAKNAENVPLQLVKIDILESQNKAEQAVDAYQSLIKQYPKELSYRNLLANHYLRRKQPDQAEHVLEQAAEDFPDRNDAKIAVIRFAEQSMGRAKAIELARGYADKTNASAQLKFELARLLLADGQKDAGKQIYLGLAEAKDNATAIQAETSLARLSVADGKADDAKARISKVLSMDARNHDALLLRAVIAMQQEKPNDAVTDLNTVLSDSPNSAQALMLLGQAYMLRGQVELGKEQYYRAIEANPNDAAIPIAFANILAQRKEYSQAESVLDRYLGRDPNNLQALQAMARVRLLRQDWLGAQQIAEKLRNLKGGDTVSQQIEGTVLQAQQKFGASNQIFQELYAKNPNLDQPIVALVQNDLNSGKKEDAKAFLNQVLKANPANTTANMLLGMVYESEGAKDKADTAFKNAVSTNPDSSEARLRYAQLLMVRGNHDEALKTLDDGLARNPDNVVLMLGVALVYQYVGDYEKAIDEYDQILKRQPRVDVAANNLASLLTDYRKDQASHERALNLALRFADSNVPYFLDTLGWAYYKVDKADQGLPLLKKAVDDAPEATILRYHLALAQIKNGDKADAKKNLEMVVKSSDKTFQEMKQAKATLDSL